MNDLVPTTWPKVNDFVQVLLGPKFLHVKKTSSSFIGSLVIQMQTPDIREVFSDKLATLKVDGERHIVILYVDENMQVRTLAMRRNGQVLEAPENTTLLRPSSVLKQGYFTILDCEFVRGVWLAFDCVVFRAIPQTVSQDFTKRYQLLQKTLDTDFECARIIIKPYFPVTAGTKNFTSEIVRMTMDVLAIPDLEYDGIVFQPTIGPYPIGQNMNLVSGRGLKWKDDLTLDLVPRPMTAKDVIRIHETLYGKSTRLFTYHIRNPKYFGIKRLEYHSPVFRLKNPLYKLECVSDFSNGIHANFTTVAFEGVPLCVSSSSSPSSPSSPSSDAVIEYEIQIHNGAFVPVQRLIRLDKSAHQANKARTVAGVLWQADFNRTSAALKFDDFIEHPDALPERIRIESPVRMFPVGSDQTFVPMDDLISRLPFGRFTDGGMEEHEFKLVQTKRPRPGNIFPATLEANFMASSFVDTLHFERIKAGLLRKYNKHEPPCVTTLDFTVDNVRITAVERSVPTKSGLPLLFYEATGFVGIRKTEMDMQSYVVDMPDVLKNSGYCFRLDSRKEMPEFFSSTEFLPDNPTFLSFVTSLEDYHRTPRKRKGGVGASSAFNAEQFKGYRLVDKQEYAKEIETNVPVERLRRTSVEPVRVGEKVQVEYQGRASQIHTATVKAIRGNVVDVQYDYSVRSMTSYSSTHHIPLVVDNVPHKNTTIRVKKRTSFTFPGFKVDLTQTRIVNNFRCGKERLHHLTSHGAFVCEIEIELLSSIRSNPGFISQLKDVMTSMFSFAGLDENSFLFNKVISNPPTPALADALKSYDDHLSSDRDIDPIFVRAARGVVRVVPESDFFSTTDAEAEQIFGKPRPMYSLELENLDFTKLSIFADRSDVALDHCLKRRLLQGVSQVEGSMYFVMGAVQLAYNRAWKDPEFWTYLVGRMRIPVVLEADDELIQSMEEYLRTGKSLVESAFLEPGLKFGGEIATSFYFSSQRAWWDPEESALAWNDLIDCSHRYSNEVVRAMKIRPDEEDVVFYVESIRAITKLSVIVGAVKSIRDCCAENEVPVDLLDSQVDLRLLEKDRRIYSPSSPQIDLTNLKGIRVVLEY